MKKSQLKQLIKEQILVEVEAVSDNQQIHSFNVDGKKIELKLDEDNRLGCENLNLKTLIINDLRVKEIYCNNNQLTTLKLGYLPNLKTLHCSDNQLTSLDVSKCPNLKILHCNDNQLKSLNVSKCLDLKTLHCSDNQLTSLDISNCPKLKYLSYDEGKTELIKRKLNEVKPIAANPIYICEPWALKVLNSKDNYDDWADRYGEDTADALVLLSDVIAGGNIKEKFIKKDVERAFKRSPSHMYTSLDDMWGKEKDNLNNKVDSLIKFFKEYKLIKQLNDKTT